MIAPTVSSSRLGFSRPRRQFDRRDQSKYLGSGMIRGIGPVYAKKMIKAFGEKVFDYLIDLKHAVIVDVEATTTIRQAEVGATKTMSPARPNSST